VSSAFTWAFDSHFFIFNTNPPFSSFCFSELGREYECTVNAICPGPTNAYGFKHAPPEFMKNIQPLLDTTPVAPRMAEPEEIAVAVGFLCEPRANWITGVCLGVNGGFFMS
jgi:NAD(P)-dependent dehydrogenase (short-subunit alcohol dehydrogenase family)